MDANGFVLRSQRRRFVLVGVAAHLAAEVICYETTDHSVLVVVAGLGPLEAVGQHSFVKSVRLSLAAATCR